MCLFVKYHKKTKALICMTLFFQVFQVVNGFDFGFFYSRREISKVSVKLISLAICTAVTMIPLLSVIFKHDAPMLYYIWHFVFYSKFIAYAIFLAYTKSDKSFYSFYCSLRSTDSKFGIFSSSFNTEVKLLCTCLISISLRLLVISLYCINGFGMPTILLNYSYSVAVLGMDVLLVSYAFIFCSVDGRLKNLLKVLKKTKSGYITHQIMYKYYVDLLEKYKNALDPLLVLTLCFTIPEVMISIYDIVQRIMYHLLSVNDPSTYLEYVTAIITLSSVVAPALCASVVSTTVDRIKLLLHDKLLDERDPVRIRELVRFVQYVEARGCQFRVYKVLPLDADLLGMVLGFCATYLIVIIQFTSPH